MRAGKAKAAEILRIVERVVERVAPAVVGAAAFAILIRAAEAQAFPQRPIRLVVAAPSGGGVDEIARYIAKRLAPLGGQRVQVDNVVDGNDFQAARAVAAASPDGYTLLFDSDVDLLASLADDSAGGSAAAAVTAIAGCAETGFTLVVPPAAPLKTPQDLVLKLKAKRGGSFGYFGAMSLLAGRLFARLAGAQATPVAYPSIAAATAKIADGTLDYMIMDGGAAVAAVQRGAAKALAATADQRELPLPDTPTLMEGGTPNFVFLPWWGVFAPSGTPRPVLDQIEAWLLRIDASPRTAAFLEARAADPSTEDSSAARARFANDGATWIPLIKEAEGAVK